MYSEFIPLKTLEETQKRLIKLTNRYRDLYVKNHTDKLPCNCVHNYLHSPKPLPFSNSIENQHVPNRSIQLVVIQEEKPVRICTYGSEKPTVWNGDICDSEAISQECPYFTPIKERSELIQEYDSHLEDDKHVLEHYPDVAALQWVLNDRSYKIRFSFFSYLIAWYNWIIRRFK